MSIKTGKLIHLKHFPMNITGYRIYVWVSKHGDTVHDKKKTESMCTINREKYMLQNVYVGFENMVTNCTMKKN